MCAVGVSVRVCARVCACTLPMPTSATHEGARAYACLHSFALCSRAHTLLKASDFGITCASVVLFALTGTSGSQTRYTPWQVGGLHVTSDAAQNAALCRRPMVSLLVQLHSSPLSTVEHHTHTQVHSRSRWWTTFAFTHARMRTRTHASIGESLVNHRSFRNRRRLMPSDADRAHRMCALDPRADSAASRSVPTGGRRPPIRFVALMINLPSDAQCTAHHASAAAPAGATR